MNSAEFGAVNLNAMVVGSVDNLFRVLFSALSLVTSHAMRARGIDKYAICRYAKLLKDVGVFLKNP